MNTVLCVAPHSDDETLGCGGTLLRHKLQGDKIHWLIMTKIKQSELFTKSQARRREEEIQKVFQAFEFNSMQQATFLPTQLDTVPKKKILEVISEYFNKVEPDIVYVPYMHDVHSDHKVVFESVISCVKSFRFPFVKKVCAYETLSETEFSIQPNTGFQPNMWVDISDFLEKKIEIMQYYKGELEEHPFPRSINNLRALATLRGSTINTNSAEAFIILKEII